MEEFEFSGELTVPHSGGGQRLDQYLPGALRPVGVDLSRSRIQELIKSGHFRLNAKVVKPRAEVAEGDVIEVKVPRQSTEVLPEEMDLKVLFEDDHIIVIDKAPGLVVHPGSGNDKGTLVNGLLHHCNGQLSRLADEGRPGIVHRLDKETSGCLVAAKTDIAYQSLVEQFSQRKTKKSYVAIASGVPVDDSGRIENLIGRHPFQRRKMAVVDPPAGKQAITEYVVSHSSPGHAWSWIDCRILTGRTHQIRVHLKDVLRCPILGDTIYAQPGRQKTRVDRLMLHARVLELSHPESGETMTFEAPLPEAFERFCDPGN
ncbi:MAG: RluA family pseudouridine synthase [Verrucomicrobiales bacterium]|nr:RluA family pseudouridine synthase [Verrucomicrobiales bacterium]